MNRHNYRWMPVFVAALVGLVLGLCLADLAEAASYTYRVCSAVKSEELSASKTSPPTLVPLAVGDCTLLGGLGPSGSAPLDPTPAPPSAWSWEGLSSRAPPALL